MQHNMQEMTQAELEATNGGIFKEIGAFLDSLLTALGEGLKWAIEKGQELYSKYAYLLP